LLCDNPYSRAADDVQSVLPRQWVASIEFICSTPSKAVGQIIDLVHEGSGQHVHLANAYTVALADKSIEYRSVLARPAINFPDGKPIAWVSALRRQNPRLHQVRGPQFFLDVIDQGRTFGIRHFLLGSTPETLAQLESNLAERFPGVEIVGSESPAFRQLRDDEIEVQDSRIRDSGAQVVWVGLGTPKQDHEAARLAAALPVVAIAIGAAFDFAAGTTKQAPTWMAEAGFEWVFRFATEPRRLWKRYVFGNIRFIKAAVIPSNRGF
jgi:N-acetylglucosaminyldiphosphoundecaprenol N-acetyl-beta-D-mannosaminyltransferase